MMLSSVLASHLVELFKREGIYPCGIFECLRYDIAWRLATLQLNNDARTLFVHAKEIKEFAVLRAGLAPDKRNRFTVQQQMRVRLYPVFKDTFKIGKGCFLKR